MNKVAAFALRRKNSVLSMSEKMFCPPQPLRFWITPACAGKRLWETPLLCRNGDHPRMCGEKKFIKCFVRNFRGSPLRVRGKAWGRCCPDRLRWDHPRVCGEKLRIVEVGRVKEGSPPRMRGKGVDRKIALLRYGITPACAGKSCAPQYGTQS